MKAAPLLTALGIAGFLAWSAAFTVTEVEQAIVTQFGKPTGDPITEPGLYWKIPFIQKVWRFDRRWLEWDGDADEMPTREKTYIWVDTYARWRIVDPLKFFTSVRNEFNAQSRLDDIIDSETRNVIAAHDLIEVVRSSNRPFAATADEGETNLARTREKLTEVQEGREKLAEMILEKARKAMPDFGIELVDIQFQRVTYTESVRQKVYERMISERKRIAERYRSEGEGKSAEILGKKERELARIASESYKKAQTLKGEADAKATAIYAKAHNADPELYRLLKSLDSYKRSVDQNTVAILSTELDYLKPLAEGLEAERRKRR